MNKPDEINFVARVSARVEAMYGLEDGGDLCFNLLEAGIIPKNSSLDEAAIIVAQYLTQL